MLEKKLQKKSASISLPGVGKQITKYLAKLNIFSLQDLLWHLPKNYQDRTQIFPIRKVRPGMEVLIEGTLYQVELNLKSRSKLLCELKDGTGKIWLRFFHIYPFQINQLKPHCRLRCFGEVRLGPRGFEMVHPEFEVLTGEIATPLDKNLTPIYPATQGITQRLLRKLVKSALDWIEQSPFPELLPETLLQTLSLPTLAHALKTVHHPPRDIPIDQLLASETNAQRRLIMEELIAHRLSLLHIKKKLQKEPGILLKPFPILIKKFLNQLPFKLTTAQKRVVEEIEKDLFSEKPMLRLLQGDVGCGKTIVAAMAMLSICANHYQAALMAPTELLAEQHYQTFTKWFAALGFKVVFLTGSMKTSDKKRALTLISDGDANIIIGSHALFQEKVRFAKLALVVTDEQHRFGVQQRALFLEKGKQDSYYPHQLIMTATPIPRTLAMSLYADLDCSLIDELPPGRTPIVTAIIPHHRRAEVISRVRATCEQGKQVYWVCPLIEESDVIHSQAATKIHEQLQQMLPELKIGLIHGRLSSSEKELQMRAFQQNKIHLLVATTIIEVGVDVPNATVMVIENAERLGLAQLHQLRGRVGRGKAASHCLLLYQAPLSELGQARLQVMRETTDGFKIAERDLVLRGPGEILGTKQTGELTFKVANLIRDRALLTEIHQASETIMRDHSHLLEPLIERWLGREKQFAKV